MMIGHLTLAGLAEAVITAGMVSYLQRADVGLLRGVSEFSRTGAPDPAVVVSDSSPRRLWWAVGLLMLLAPLGVLATGTAWGEWSASAWKDPQTQTQITAASRDQAPPPSVPEGLHKLSSIWTAPFPAYAPRFVKTPAFGYLLSAMFGVGLFVLISLAASVASRKPPARELAP
jgi:cobalt/nickel transport system permease protein